MLEASGEITISDNTGGTADLVLNGGSIVSGVNPQFLDLADGTGNVHNHLEFDLTDSLVNSDDFGAYGLLVQLQSDHSPGDGTMT